MCEEGAVPAWRKEMGSNATTEGSSSEETGSRGGEDSES